MKAEPVWLFETDIGFMACGYDTEDYAVASGTCSREYAVTVLRGIRAQMPFPEYRALLLANRSGHGWEEAYSMLIGVFLDAYTVRRDRT